MTYWYPKVAIKEGDAVNFIIGGGHVPSYLR